MSRDSKPGGATPHSLYKMYKSQGAVQANPYTLRQQFGIPQRTIQQITAQLPHGGNPIRAAQSVIAQPVAFSVNSLASRTQSAAEQAPSRQRSDSPPRMQFRVIQARGTGSDSRNSSISLSLASLNMNRSH